MTLQLATKDIRKQFGDVLANDAISVSFDGGRIYAILGENGAGKTTFLNILFGLYEPDSGHLSLNGSSMRLNSPKDAMNRGIYLVQQNFSLIENFTVAENLAILEGPSLRFLDLKNVVQKAESSSKHELKFSVNPRELVAKLPMNLRQIVEIEKGLLRGSNILLLDEPTSVLGPQEAEDLGKVLKGLAAEGKLIILTSHKLSQVIKLCDDYVIMRKGKVIFTGRANDLLDASELIRYMFGEDILGKLPQRQATGQELIMEANNLKVEDHRGRVFVSDLSLKVYSGEVVGIAGVAGNGQKEFAEAITGMRIISGGDVKIQSESIRKKPVSYLRRHGLAFVPEEGSLTGIVPNLSVAENLALTTYDLDDSSPLLNMKAISSKADRLINDYGISPPSKTIAARNLSGGNMHKLIVARELSREKLSLLVLYNPTKGLDLKTTLLVHQRTLEKRNAGTAVVLVSEDLEELLELSDRIAVMFEGRIVGMRGVQDLTIRELGRMMSGHAVNVDASGKGKQDREQELGHIEQQQSLATSSSEARNSESNKQS